MNNITKREYNCVLYYLASPLFLGLGFTKLISLSGKDVWLSGIIGIILGCFINYIFAAMKDKGNKFLTSIYSFGLLLIGSSIISRTIGIVYLNKTPVFIILLALLLLVYYLCSKNESTIYKVASITIFISALLVITTIGALLPYPKIDNLLPVFNTQPLKIILASVRFALISCTPYILLPDFKEKYNYKAYLLSSLTTLVMMILIVGILSARIINIYEYPEYIVLKKIMVTNAIENVEKLLFASWLFGYFPLLAIASKNIQKNSSSFILILSLLLVLIINTLFSSPLFEFIKLNYPYLLLSLLGLYFLSKLFYRPEKLT